MDEERVRMGEKGHKPIQEGIDPRAPSWCWHCHPELLQHPELPSHRLLGSSPGDGLADLLAFPLLTFMTLIMVGVIAYLICFLKRWGGDWFYNNNSSDS